MQETQETWVQSLGREDPLTVGMATHSSILDLRIPWTEEPGGLQSMGSQRVAHHWSDLAALAQGHVATKWWSWDDNTQVSYYSVVQLPSRVQLFATPWTVCQAAMSLTVSRGLPKFMFIALVLPSNYLILCHPLFLLPSIFPSIRVFSNRSVLCIRWPKYCSFSISPSNEYSGLISFMMDWFDLLAVQGTLKSLLQNHSSKAPILQSSALWSNSHIHTWLLEKL